MLLAKNCKKTSVENITSKKRNRNRVENNSFSSPENTNEKSGNESLNSSLQPDNKSNKSTKFTYLKTHWWVVGLIALFSLSALGAGWKYLDENARQTLAQREAATPLNPSQEDLLSQLNPLVPAALPTPTPQLSKEYIYAGSRLLAVEDKNATAAPPADLAIFRPSTGGWWVLNSSGQGYVAQAWGVTGDKPVEGDYDGDGKTDFAIFHPVDGSWQVFQTSTSSGYGFQFGVDSDEPVQADYDGDGKTDFAIFRKDSSSNGVWYIRKSSNGSVMIQQWGLDTDTPVPADFDGDGKADLAVFRSSEAKFYYLRSGQDNASYQMIAFGQPGDKPVPGDYDGDGKADAAVWRANYTWHILNSSNGAIEGYTFGDPNSDKYVQNDYDGDGRVDRAFWRPSNGTWYIVNSSTNTQRVEQWGMAGDIPVPAFYRR